MKEIWKDVIGFEGLYEVSNMGNVKSVDRYVKGKYENSLKLMKGKNMRLKKNREGYLAVGLSKCSKQKILLVHRLVWEAFNGNIQEGYQVNHIDENKTNNILSNLNIMTAKENVNWGTRNLRASKSLKNHPNMSFQVAQYKDGKLISIYPSTKEAQRITGISSGNISQCCRGGYFDTKRNKWYQQHYAGGYHWEYL